MKIINKVIVMFVIIISILCLNSKTIYAEYKNPLHFNWETHIDVGGKTVENQIIFCKNKGYSLDGSTTFTKDGGKHKMSAILARAIYLIIQDNKLIEVKEDKRAVIQWILWLQSEKAYNTPSLRKYVVNDYISTNKNLINDSDAINSVNPEAFKTAKETIIKAKKEETGSDDEDYVDLELKKGNATATNLSMEVDANGNYTQCFKLVYNHVKAQNYIKNLIIYSSNIQEYTISYETYNETKDTWVEKGSRIMNIQDKDDSVAEDVDDDDNNGTVRKVMKKIENKTFDEAFPENKKVRIRITIPKDKIDINNATLKIKVGIEGKILGDSAYSGTYQKYKKEGGEKGQNAVSIEVNNNKPDANEDYKTVKFNFRKQGNGAYVKYLDSVYKIGYDTSLGSINVNAGYGKIGNCTRPEWDPITGECVNKEELCQPSYIDGNYANQQVKLDSNAENSQYIFIYKIQYANNSSVPMDMATITRNYNNLNHADNENMYGTRIVDKYTDQSMHLGWINRITEGQSAEYLDENPTVTHPNGNSNITVTRDITLWRDTVQGKDTNTYTYYEDGSIYTGRPPVEVGGTCIYLDTAVTANETLPAAKEGEITIKDAFSFVFFYQPQNQNNVRDAVNVSSNPVWLHSNTNIKGQIFNDNYDYNSGKPTGVVNGQYNAGEEWNSGDNVRVQIYNENKELVSEVLTNNGYYEFNELEENYFNYENLAWTYDGGDSIQEIMANKKKYVVRFLYNGEKYESTIFNEADDGRTDLSRAVECGDLPNGGEQPWSRCSRKEFNEGIIVNTTSKQANDDINIWAEVGSNTYLEDANSVWISSNTSYREHVNLGLITRYFDLNTTVSLESMVVTENKVVQEYKGYGSPTISAEINEADLNQKLEFTEADYTDEDNSLEVWVNYKVKVTNESAAYNADATVNIYCDNRFSALKYGNSPEIPLSYNNGSSSIVKLSSFNFKNIESSQEMNISMKLNKNTIKNIMETNGTDFLRTLDFVAEIGKHSSYYKVNPYGKGHNGEIAGKLDEDSIPGNFDINIYNNCTSSLERHKYVISEDDTSRAFGVQLTKSGGSRIISGYVFEDETEVKNNVRLGNGKYDKLRDKLIKGVNVTLKDEFTGKEYNTKTDENGKYTIENVIPSAYYTLKFTYGNGDTKYYNSQDYKSTIDKTNNNYEVERIKIEQGYTKVPYGESKYWYSQTKGYSIAKDVNINKNEEFKVLNNNNAVKLENYALDNSSELNLSNEAKTKSFLVPITEYGDSNKSAAFEIAEMDFGLAERPRSELTLHKKVDHITIITSDGRTLIDGKQGKINSTSWTQDKYVQAIVDENLIYGSTLKITYKYTVENTGELDYNTQEFYNYGIIPNNKEPIKTKADKIIDYIDNNLMYEETMQANPESTELNSNYWNIAKEEEKALLGEDAKNGAKEINTILTTDKLNKELQPEKETDPIYLTVSKVLSSSEDSNAAFTYNNYAEIIQSTNELGRRSYSTKNKKLLSDLNEERGTEYITDTQKAKTNYVLSIPGDLNPNTLTTIEEPDSDKAQEVQIVPPFGSQRVIWTIIATVSSIILAVGIILTKKKVLK